MYPSLFNRLGGEATVQAAVNMLVEKLHSAPELNAFFSKIDAKTQERKLISFFTILLQGKEEAEYAPHILRTYHAPLVKEGLNDKHYDLFMQLAEETLHDLKLHPEYVEEFVELIESFRQDVLLK